MSRSPYTAEVHGLIEHRISLQSLQIWFKRMTPARIHEGLTMHEGARTHYGESSVWLTKNNGALGEANGICCRETSRCEQSPANVSYGQIYLNF